MGAASLTEADHVRQVAQEAAVNLDEDQCALLAAHLAYVLEANERVRLTAIRSFQDGLRLHILDSLMIVGAVHASPAGPVLDMGSGGGYPGIPIAVATGRHVTLIDSVGKKMRIMQEFIDSTPVIRSGVATAIGRVEAMGEWVPRDGFAVVVARALSSLPALVELAAPLLMTGGHLVCMKGDLAEDELDRGNKVAGMVGLSLIDCTKYTLPHGGESRSTVVYARTGKPKIRLPRREGMAQRQPLA